MSVANIVPVVRWRKSSFHFMRTTVSKPVNFCVFTIISGRDHCGFVAAKWTHQLSTKRFAWMCCIRLYRWRCWR